MKPLSPQSVRADAATMGLDFVQACHEVHRHYILAAVGEVLEDALATCGDDEVRLRLALASEMVDIVESARLHGGRFECDPGVLAPTRFTEAVGVGCIIGPTNGRHVHYVWSQRMLEREMDLGYVAQRVD